MTYARFTSPPIGPQLGIHAGGLLLTTIADALNIQRAARVDIGHASGVHGLECVAWGDDPLKAVIGVVTQSASLSTFPGGDAQGIGWRLDTGQIFVGNSIMASGLPIIGKGEIVGLQVDFNAARIRFYRGANLVHERALPAGQWFAAVGLGSERMGGLSVALNSGQWQRATPAGTWQAAPPAMLDVRLADADYLTASSDTPANTRYEAVIDDGGFETLDQLHFWPWGDEPRSAGAATVRLLDAEGRVDPLLDTDITGLPVSVRVAFGALANAASVGRYVATAVEAESDSRKTLYLSDASDDVRQPLNRGVFLPNIPALAWRPQPVVIGAVASIPASSANSDNTVLFAADSPLQAVSLVRDRGDAMELGTWQQSPDGQQILMASPSMGPVVADGSTIGSNVQGLIPATLEQFLAECFRRAGTSSWSVSDAAAIDTATGYAGIGFHAAELVDVWHAITAALASYGAWPWRDGNGILRFARAVAPETAPLDFYLDDADLLRDVVRVDDRAPALSRRMGYRPQGYVHQASDLVTDIVDVPPELRQRLTRPHWGEVYSDAPLSPLYRHADSAAPRPSLHWREQDAQAELERVLSMYGLARATWRWEMHDTGNSLRPGMTGSIRCDRYAALRTGKRVLIRAVQRNAVTGRTILTLWG
ncbi:MAG: hypothetical protein Q4G71_09975 [Pseudomonadota bacterium]|nr:hypothetical protein [Pseudomonadota bacterium]